MSSDAFQVCPDSVLLSAQSFAQKAPLSRITISLDDDQHRSLKLLSILESKTLAQVVQEAIQEHLRRKGADRLEVTQGQPRPEAD